MSTFHPRTALAIGLAGLNKMALVACSSPTTTAVPTKAPVATTPPAATGAVTVKLDTLSNSGQSGTATLTSQGSQTLVVLNLNAGPAGSSTAQPVHIHKGNCGPTLADVAYPLTDLKGGKSTTTVPASLNSLRTGAFAINAHKSLQEIAVYTTCGNISAKAGAGAGTSNTDSSGYDYNY